ncbi:MAG: cytochrome c biogenesis protein CcdA [Bacteroidales bacterium]|nr:cytochrome c biogenesis protein CcdA [Bacteroidales bacterium]
MRPLLNKAKRFSVIFLILITTSGFSFSQINIPPSKWNYSITPVKVKTGDTATISFNAVIPEGFHLYSSDFFCKIGPNPATFVFDKKGYSLVGKVKAIGSKKEYDDVFKCTVTSFYKKGLFKQKIKVTEPIKEIKCTITYQMCTNTDGACVNYDKNIKIPLTVLNNGNAKPTADTIKTDIAKTSAAVDKSCCDKIKTTATDNEISGNLWIIFLEGILAGFLALITPCVFPMIPMTVSFFLKRTEKKIKAKRDAIIYGFSIIIIYVALGFGITLLFGADALNSMSTNTYVNLFFFLLLLVFAASFFGAFELQLPSKWTTAADSKAEKSGGLIGIFLMAFTLVLVSFSCTAPIIGTLLVEAAVSKNTLSPLIGMLGFSMALAIPFALLAIFPSWLNSLPKSGGWLNSVKVTLGFLLIALSLKFFSTADLVNHWGILNRGIFLIIWIVIFILLGIYLLGKIKFAHDSDVKYVSIARLIFAIISFSFAAYLIPGLWGAPLKAISAFTPPQYTQDFDLTKNTSSNNQETASGKKYADLFHCPYNLNCFFDYDEGMEYAKKSGKPVIVDFTGWGCAYCKKMKASVWSDAEILKRLNENYVLITLYADDKTTLPEKEQYETTVGGIKKEINTIGKKWSDLQATKFKINSLPYYALLDNEGELLIEPKSYDLSIKNFIDFLDKGIKEYEKRKAEKNIQ